MNLQRQLSLSALGALLLCGSAFAQSVRDAQRLNTTGFNPNGNNRIDGAVVTSRGSEFYAAWTEQFGTTEFTQDIYFARSVDDGATWSVPVRVDLGDAPNAADSDLPKIAVTDTGVIGVVWEEVRDAFQVQSTNDDIFFNRSLDGGLTWQATSIPLNVGTAGAHVTSDIDRIWLAASGSTFHVTWEEDSLTGLGGSEEVWYTRSTDAGATWSTPIILNANPGSGNDVDEPKVEADGSLVVVTYVDAADDVIAHRSTDGGATWSGPIAVESDPNGNADEPVLQVKGDRVVVAWTEQDPGTPGGEGVHVAVSVDGGLTWRAEETLSLRQVGVVGADADSPKVAIQSPNSFFVVYDEDSVHVSGGGATGSSVNECLVAYTNDAGLTWTKDVPLWAGVTANRPYVVATDGAVAVYMEQNPNGSNVGAFTYSLDSGATWAAQMIVGNTGPDVDEGAGRDEGVYMTISTLTDTVVVTHMDRPLGQNEVYASGLLLSVSLGTNYCRPAVQNTSGSTGVMGATGSRFVANDNLTLRAAGLPANQFGFFLASQTQGFVANPGGSQGHLCLAGTIGRYVGAGQIKNSGANGRFELAIQPSQTPAGSVFVSILAGQSWNFQAWFRDTGPQGQPWSNFTDGLTVLFQ